MTRYILQRLAIAAAVAIALSFVTFMLLNAALDPRLRLG